MLDAIKKGNVPKEKMEHIFNYVLHLAEIEGKYQEQKEEIKKGVRIFIEAALGNRLNQHLGEFNVTKFDVDGQKGWDNEEENNFGKAIQESIGQIIVLGGLERFSTTCNEANPHSGVIGQLANAVNFEKLIPKTKNGKHFAE
ncbi:hypothetical protein AUK10_03910 [Candidatus Gracilibacteria bacterium CG2_30_37_12]|nr:MAG: hypothetical protein AUK10_03910 [Candidatus Gracilibacteria bacterium CG2_30_37_12]